MIERLFCWTGHLCTALMVIGLAAIQASPGATWGTAIVYAALVVLMLTPVSRVMVACVRFARAGDRGSALLTVGILVVIAISAITAWGK